MLAPYTVPPGCITKYKGMKSAANSKFPCAHPRGCSPVNTLPTRPPAIMNCVFDACSTPVPPPTDGSISHVPCANDCDGSPCACATGEANSDATIAPSASATAANENLI